MIFQPDEYYTLKKPSEGLYKEKGSKFLSYAYPVHSEEEIKGILQLLKKMHFDARHHCFAWQLGKDSIQFRSNDDGEPSGTAGKPIYGQILSHELSNVLVVVIRYFGGTKLGTSGLIHAYKTASADAIAHSEIVKLQIHSHYRVSFNYEAMNDVMRIIKEEEPQIYAQNFELRCQMHLSVRRGNAELFCSKLSKITSVKIQSDDGHKE